MNDPTVRHRFFSTVLPMLFAIAGIAIHLWSGWIDDHHFHLVPSGHGLVLAMYAWIVTLMVSGLAFALGNPRSRWAEASAVIALIGAALIVVPALLHLS